MLNNQFFFFIFISLSSKYLLIIFAKECYQVHILEQQVNLDILDNKSLIFELNCRGGTFDVIKKMIFFFLLY